LLRFSSLLLRIILPGRPDFKLLSRTGRVAASFSYDEAGGGELPEGRLSAARDGTEK
jgi:hypothetical protein